MRKLTLILFFGFLISCSKEDFEPIPTPKTDIDVFTLSEATISDGDEIKFALPSDSTYILRLVDKNTGQTVSKQRFQGKFGINKMKFYTKTLQSKYLFLVLENNNKNQINKTTITVK